MIEYLKIVKGDDSNFALNQNIFVQLITTHDITGMTAEFQVYDYIQTFNPIPADKKLPLVFPACVTRKFPLGRCLAKIRMFDTDGKRKTITNQLPVLVIDKVYGEDGEDGITFSVHLDMSYNELRDKPKINGVEVVGAKLGKDYQLNKILDYSATLTYAVGDQVVRDKNLFSCVVAINTPEAWNASHWEEIGGGADPNAVHYTADTNKSPAEKTQARQNIEAASSSDLSAHTSNHNNPHSVTKAQVGLSDVDNTSDMSKPVSSAQQTALNAKVSIASLKAAFADPNDVKLSPASIKSYLIQLYTAIQSL